MDELVGSNLDKANPSTADFERFSNSHPDSSISVSRETMLDTDHVTTADVGEAGPVDDANDSSSDNISDRAWQHAERKSLPFLEGMLPLNAPVQAATLYFPTVRYRNRRVPGYNLPHLLGRQMAADLIKDTVFRDVTYVALTMHRGLLDTHYMLQKLQAYLAEGKNIKV